MTHFVYIAGCPENNFTPLKIGIADNVEKRLSSLQTGSPIEIIMLAGFAFNSKAAARKAESLAHHHFARRRVRNEWFAVPFFEIDNYLSRLKVTFKGRFGMQEDSSRPCFSNVHLHRQIWTQNKKAA